MPQDIISKLLGGYQPQTFPQAAGFVTGTALAGKSQDIRALRAAAAMERSAQYAEASVDAFDELLGDPALMESLIDRDPYFQKHPKGAAYLKALLKQTQFTPPGEMEPEKERGAYYGQLEKALAPHIPTGGFPPESELYAGVKGQLAGPYGKRYPSAEEAAAGVPPGAAGEALSRWGEYTAGKYGWQGPVPTAETAAGLRAGPEEVPPVPEEFTAWRKAQTDLEFNDLSKAD